MANILMINVPFHGHVNPTIAIATELVNRGHKLTYLISEEFREKIEPTGANIIVYNNVKEIGLPPMGMRLIMKGIYETALRIGKEYDCIIYEFMFFMGKQLGDTLNIPIIRLISMFAFNKYTIMTKLKNPEKSSLLLKIIHNKLVKTALTLIFVGNGKLKLMIY